MKNIFAKITLFVILSALSLSAGMTKEQIIDNLEFRKAIEARSAKDFKSAFDIFTKLSTKKYAKAKYNLAIMYQLGEGTKQDEQKALSLFKEAAEMGDEDAVVLMAENYYYGRGVKEDRAKAKYYLKSAKKIGNKKAEYLWKKYKFEE